MTVFHILALSGSLRAASLNTAMLRMAQSCAPANVQLSVFEGLGDVPPFNPDLESDAPEAVLALDMAIRCADAVLIASPEYAHGVSGVLKNALDWMVSRAVLVDKPVALWNAAPRASHALAALRETLEVMASRLVASADLQLLIKPPEPGQQALNPDPLAMQAALLRLVGHQYTA